MPGVCRAALSTAFFVLLVLTGCGSSEPNATPTVALLTRAGMPVSVTGCYDGAAQFTSATAAVNNVGLVAANVQADPATGCATHGYLWDVSAGTVSILPFATPDAPDVAVSASLSVLSTNGVGGGITFTAPPGAIHPDERATCTDGLGSRIIHGYNYVFGVSENGAYLTGTNLGRYPLLLDRASFEPFNLTMGGVLADSMMLYQVSNDGVAVGTWMPGGTDVRASGVVCQASSASCAWVVGGNDQGFDAFIQGISADGSHVYGFASQDLNVQLFSVNPVTWHVTPLDPGYLIGSTSPVTDDGSLVVKDGNYVAYLFVPFADGGHAIYAMAELVTKLDLPGNLDADTVQLSPNGKYALFDVIVHGPQDLFAARVHFPSGVASWAKANLTPVTQAAGLPILTQ